MKQKLLVSFLSMLTPFTFASDYVVVVSKKHNDYSYGSGSTNPDPDEPILRNLCVDILNRGESKGNGIYEVDVDGIGEEYSSKQAYCDMTGGGWTLYDSFGGKLRLTNESGTPAYNAMDINSTAAIKSAGYEIRTGEFQVFFNESAYPLTDYHIQYHARNASSYKVHGWIKKTMPEWIQGIRINSMNITPPSQSDSVLTYKYDNNGVQEKIIEILPTIEQVDQLVYFENITGGAVLEYHEEDMGYLESMWVK